MSREVCRLCLSTSNLRPIFIDLGKSERYTQVLVLTTGLNIEPDDGLPQKICEDCIESVNSSMRFRNKCHLSHIKLAKLNFNTRTSSKTVNNSPKRVNMLDYRKENNDSEDGFPDFQIEVECQRMTDLEKGHIPKKDGGVGGNFDIQDGGPNEISGKNNNLTATKMNKTSEIKTISRKERRERYLELVDGVFDPKGPVKCRVCKKTVSKWSCFISHAKLHLGFKFMCEYCGKSFISSTQLKRHCRSHHGMERELACRHCSFLALDKGQLVLHERRVHTGERPFVCAECGARYHSRRCLLQHVEGHRTVATVQCERCPLKFKSARHLARHRYSAHAHRNRRQRDK